MSDRIEVDDILHPGDERWSGNGEYRLVLQDDNNFVLYKKIDDDGNQEPIWASNTYLPDESCENKQVIMQQDGNLVLYNEEGNPLWDSGSSGYGAVSPYILVQDDGNVVLYDNEVEGVFWSTDTTQ